MCPPTPRFLNMQEPFGTLFVSIPSLLDPSLCPPGTHVFHAFSPDWIDAWQGLAPDEYERRKEEVSEREGPGLQVLAAAVRHGALRESQ